MDLRGPKEWRQEDSYCSPSKRWWRAGLRQWEIYHRFLTWQVPGGMNHCLFGYLGFIQISTTALPPWNEFSVTHHLPPTSRPQLWEGSSQDTLYPQHSVSSHFLQLTFIRVQIWVSRLWVEVRICISSKLPVTRQQGLSTQTCWLNKNCSWNLDLQSTLLLCFLVYKKGLHITCHWVLRQGEKHSGENPPWPNPLSSVEMPSIVESEWRASPDPLDGHK